MFARKRKRYRSKGGWVNGTYWHAGRVGELYEIQGDPYVPAILVPVDQFGKPIAALQPQDQPPSVAPSPARDVPAKIVNLPPVAAQRQRRRVGMSVGVPAAMPMSTANLTPSITRPDPKPDNGGGQ